jgi:hypothetical protein
MAGGSAPPQVPVLTRYFCAPKGFVLCENDKEIEFMAER